MTDSLRPALQPALPGRALPSRPAPGRFYTLAAALLAGVPIAMVVASRSSPLFVTLAAAAALAGAGRQGRLPALLAQARDALRHPLGLTIIAFAAWALVSVAWSPFPGTSLHMLGEFLLPIAAGFTLAHTLPGRVDAEGWVRIAGMCAIVAAVLLVLDMKSGLVVRAAFGARAAEFVHNRPALTLLVLLPGLAVALARQGRGGWIAVLCLASAAAIFVSVSGAAKFGLAAGAVAFGLAFLFRRFALGLGAAALFGVLAMAPVFGDLADRLVPEPVVARLARAHAQDRIDIWRSFGAAVGDQPLAGAGFGTSGRFGETPSAARVAADFRPLLDIGHPHNVPLQIWVETGAVGCALAALVAAFVLRGIDGLSGMDGAAALALLAGGLAVCLVGQGAWQGWWPAGIGASLVWWHLPARAEGTHGRV